METTHEQTTTDPHTDYADPSIKRVTAENSIEYAYRDFGAGDVPLVLLQHFRGNLDNWELASRGGRRSRLAGLTAQAIYGRVRAAAGRKPDTRIAERGLRRCALRRGPRRSAYRHSRVGEGRMSSDVIIGHDGKPRCAWAGAGDTALGGYHDEVWGTRTYDESALFEALTLGVFEVGLSWSIVFGKRDAFRKAFRGFDVAKVAAMTERNVDRLVQDASIIRNRAKIQATVDNARAMLSASPSLAALAKSYEITRKRAPRSIAGLPKSTPHAETFAKQLKSQGYRFVGPTSVYAFMQNVGVVNDHLHGCFRATD